MHAGAASHFNAARRAAPVKVGGALCGTDIGESRGVIDPSVLMSVAGGVLRRAGLK